MNNRSVAALTLSFFACSNIPTPAPPNEPPGPSGPVELVAPRDLSATASHTVQLTWSGTATRYQVERATNSGGPYEPRASTTDASYLDTSVLPGTTYYYVVTSLSDNGLEHSPRSSEVSALTLPAPPTHVLASPTANEVSLTWSAVQSATSYTVMRSASPAGPFTTIATPTSADVTDTALSAATTFYYRVSAANATGNSDPSSTVSALTPPSAPAAVSALAGNGQVRLTWQPVSGASEYVVSRGTSSAGPYILVTTTTLTRYDDVTVANDTVYYYTVQASNASGPGAASSAANALPQATLPPFPVPDLAAIGGDQHITLTWSGVYGASGYVVSRGSMSGGPYTPHAVVSTPGFSDSALGNGLTYYYVVQAESSQLSVYSNEASASTTPDPQAPTLLSATAGDGTVALTWTLAAGASSYIAFATTTAGNYGPNCVTGVTTGTTFTFDGLTNEQTYYFVVRGQNSVGTSTPSNELSATPLTPVAGLAATPSLTQVSVTWNPVGNPSGATPYTLYRASVPGGPYTQVGGATAATGTTDSGLSTSTWYYYMVRAQTAYGTTPPSAELAVRTLGTPDAPSNVIATASDGNVSIAWDEPFSATSYQVLRSTTPGSGHTSIGTTSSSPFLDTTVSNMTTYYYVVRAQNGYGFGGASSEVSATPTAVATNVYAYAGIAHVDLSWSAASGSPSGYGIWRATTSGGPYSKVGTTSGTAYVDGGRADDTTYYYVVRAEFGTVIGGNSAEVSATTIATAQNLSGAPSGTQIQVSWSAVPTAGSYLVQRSLSSGSGFSQVAAPTGTTYTDTGLALGTTYYYVVRAVQGAWTGGRSAELIVSTPSVPARPSNVTAIGYDGFIAVSWTAPTGAQSYTVARLVGATGPTSATAVTGATSFDDAPLPAAATYCYVVRATNSAGSSAYSTPPACAMTAPPAPSGLAAAPRDQGAVISWSTTASATNYDVYRTPGPSGPVGSTSGLSFTDGGLINGDTYSYVVRAANSAGQGPPSSQVSVSPYPPPAAPASISAQGGTRQVNVTWASATSATGYTLYRSFFSGSNYTHVVGPAAATGYLDTGLSDGVTYYYVVVANNAAGDSSSSPQASATTAPPAPTDVVATGHDGSISVIWSPASGATGYTVNALAGPSGPLLFGTNIASTGYTDTTGLQPNEQRCYRVRASNTAGDSTYSLPEACATTAPAAPTGVTASARNQGAGVTWNSVAGAASYRLYRSAGGTGPLDLVGATGALAFEDVGLTNGLTYGYAVRALNSGGEGAASSPLAIVSPYPPPDAPATVSAQASGNQVTVSWSAAATATSYTLYQYSGAVYSAVFGPTGVTGFVHTGLADGTTYRYAVTANNAVGSSSYSQEAEATTAPPAPLGGGATGGYRQVALTWLAAAGATGYTVFRAGGGVVGSTASTGLTESGLSDSQLVTYEVVAHNAAGSSPPSSVFGAPTYPAAPTLSATAGNTSVTLSWTSVATATSYQVYRREEATSFALVGATGGTGFLDSGLVNGDIYFYAVRATNLSGQSVDSNEVEAMPCSKQLAVANRGGNSVAFYCWDANGNKHPSDVLAGLATGLNGPAGVLVDRENNELFVSNAMSQSITVYDLSQRGDAAPKRTITALDASLDSPRGLAIYRAADPADDELLVANEWSYTWSASLVAALPRAASGPTTATRLLYGSATLLNGATAVAHDPVTDEVLAVNYQSGALLAFDRASMAPDLPPLRELSGWQTGIQAPVGIAFDNANGEIFVANGGGATKVAIFARGASGASFPLRTLSSGELRIPQGIAVDATEHDEFVVSDWETTSLRFFPRGASGTQASTRAITTTLATPIRMALGPNGELFVSNTYRHAVTTLPYGASGYAQPLRTWVSPSLSSFPYGIVYDHTQDEIVIADRGWPGGLSTLARAASGQSSPIRSLAEGDTLLSQPMSLAIDADAGELVTVNNGSTQVLVHSTSPLAAPTGPPLRSFGAISSPYDMCVDASHDELFVSTYFMNTIDVYPTGATGAPTPTRQITGLPGFSTSAAVDEQGGELFVRTTSYDVRFVVSVFARTANGAATALRTLVGPSGAPTSGNTEGNIIYDASRGELYVLDAWANEIYVYDKNAIGQATPLRVIKSGLASPAHVSF